MIRRIAIDAAVSILSGPGRSVIWRAERASGVKPKREGTTPRVRASGSRALRMAATTRKGDDK